MIAVQDLEDIAVLKETVELECKLAQGRDGKGQVPEDFWPTLSAFANTRGGVILLGIRETKSGFELAGVPEAEKVVKDLFNTLNNKQKVSSNILSDDNILISKVSDKRIIVVDVPPATRKEKPVYVGGNPMRGTYRRLNEGDRLCDDDTIRRMLAERVEDTRDGRVLGKFGYEDLDFNSLRTYRLMLRDARPGHPFLEQDDKEFLRSIRGWKKDRESGASGLTVAGLLMFGNSTSIQDEFPNYSLDYQERPTAKTELRWIDRVTIDGTWSGNIFDFYRSVYRKLVSDLRVPFALRDGQRQDETPVHVALREALVNSLVHADYSCPASILIVKRPDMFGFRNPGLMRVSIEQAIEGGESDGRNRTLQQMFLLVGAGEKAGSGVPKIYKGWADQHWSAPALYQREAPSEQTLLELRMMDLLPPEIIEQLHDLFGERFDRLEPDQRLALATAATEGTITHSRLNAICDRHPVDLTRMLQGLVQDGFLVQNGRSRGAFYHVSGIPPLSPDTVFGPSGAAAAVLASQSPDGSASSGERLSEQTGRREPPAKRGELKPLRGELGALGGDLGDKQGEPVKTHTGGRAVEGLEYSLIDNLDDLDDNLRNSLRFMALPAQMQGRMSLDQMASIIERVCEGHYMTLKVLAALLHREEKYLRDRILNPMIEQGRMTRAFPHRPNDPRQAYVSLPRDHPE